MPSLADQANELRCSQDKADWLVVAEARCCIDAP